MLLLLAGQLTHAQIVPNRQTIKRPTTNAKQLTLYDVILNKWKGARLTELPNALNVDSVWIEFRIDGTLSFKHQKYEFNGPTEGTWIMNGNDIKITVEKFPYTHVLKGTWSPNTGVITGTYLEVRDKDNTQPPYYTPGTNNGTFNLSRY